MITLTKVQVALLLLAALLLGLAGAVGGGMYRHHNLQHYQAEQLAQKVQAIDQVVAQLVAIEQARQRQAGSAR